MIDAGMINKICLVINVTWILFCLFYIVPRLLKAPKERMSKLNAEAHKERMSKLQMDSVQIFRNRHNTLVCELLEENERLRNAFSSIRVERDLYKDQCGDLASQLADALKIVEATKQ